MKTIGKLEFRKGFQKITFKVKENVFDTLVYGLVDGLHCYALVDANNKDKGSFYVSRNYIPVLDSVRHILIRGKAAFLPAELKFQDLKGWFPL